MIAAAVTYSLSRLMSLSEGGLSEGRVVATAEPQSSRTFIIPLRSPTADGSSRPSGRDGSGSIAHLRSTYTSDWSRSDLTSCSGDAGAYSVCLDSDTNSGHSTPRFSCAGGSGAITPVTPAPGREWRTCPGHCMLPARPCDEAQLREDRCGAPAACGGGVDADAAGGAAGGAAGQPEGPWALRAMVSALSARLAVALKLLGERDEALEQLAAELQQVKAMYRQDVEALTRRRLEGAAEAAEADGDGALAAADPDPARAAAVAVRTLEIQSLLSFIQA